MDIEKIETVRLSAIEFNSSKVGGGVGAGPIMLPLSLSWLVVVQIKSWLLT